MPDHLQVGDVVAGHRVAGGTHGAGGRAVGRGRHRLPAGQVGQGEQPRIAAAAGAADEPVAPHVLAPGHDPAPVVEPGGQPGQHGRTERRPAHLVLAGPQHPDWPAGHGPGEQHRVQGGVIGSVVAVGACPLGVVHGHLGGVQAQARREGVAQREHPLAVAPRRDGAGVPAGDRATRRHRGVGEEGAGVLGRVHRGRRGGGSCILARLDGNILGGRAEQEPLQVAVIGQGLGHPPLSRERRVRHDVAARQVDLVVERRLAGRRRRDRDHRRPEVARSLDEDLDAERRPDERDRLLELERRAETRTRGRLAEGDRIGRGSRSRRDQQSPDREQHGEPAAVRTTAPANPTGTAAQCFHARPAMRIIPSPFS